MAAHRRSAQCFIEDVSRVIPWLNAQISSEDSLAAATADVFQETIRELARYGDRLTARRGAPLEAEVARQVAHLKLQEAALLLRLARG